MTDLAGRTILLTGASKGIGAATARILGEAGTHLIAHYSSDLEGALEATAAIPTDRKLLLRADFADLGAVERLWEEAVAWRGRVDVLVNNAALMVWNSGVDESLEVWDAAWEKSWKVNVLAPARLVRQAVRHFRVLGGGSIVTISSWTAQRGAGDPGTIAYATSKAAIRCATQCVARSYAKENILAYVIAPGVVRTRLSEDFASRHGGAESVSSTLAMGAWVEPDEVGAVVAFLAGGTARNLTGATIDLNGATYIR